MCSFTAAAIIATTAYGAFAAKQSAKKQAENIEEQGEINKEVAEFNAKNLEESIEINAGVAEKNAARFFELAGETIQLGAIAGREERIAAERSIATGRARIAGSGFAVDAGTALDLVVEERGFGELNALAVMNNAAKEALGILLTAEDFEQEADIIRRTGELEVSNIRKAGEAGVFIATSQASSVRTAGTFNALSQVTAGINFLAINRQSIFNTGAS